MDMTPLQVRNSWGKNLPQTQSGTPSSSRHEELGCHAPMVKIRFAARHCNATVTGATTSEDKITAYKRKSPAQIRRNNARWKQHYERRVTRSQTVRTDDDIVPNDISEPEVARLNDNDSLSDTLNPGLLSPMSGTAECTSVSDPLVAPFTTAGLWLTSSDLAPTGVEDEVLPAHQIADVSYGDVESIFLDSVLSVPSSQESDTDDGDVGDTLASIRMLESSMMIVTTLLYIRRSLPKLDWATENLAIKIVHHACMEVDCREMI